ncbi:MAG: FAD binding domain-containing protein [Planctomycetes bacterium]|nr:FAD binding domain-containing protein [Planctomycetota bacterium]
MSERVHFLLNDRAVSSDAPAGTPLLTVVRDEFHLVGTKPGCREGDCGACTVLIGELGPRGLRYRSVVSCLTPLASVQGRHVVTVEGLNESGLSPVQRAMVEHGGQQCGFCTPGFVVSLTGFALCGARGGTAAAVEALDGNLCRCTGYAGIVRAAEEVATRVGPCPADEDPLAWAVRRGIVPARFAGVAERLAALPSPTPAAVAPTTRPIAGGTDLLVGERWHREAVRPLPAGGDGRPSVAREGDELVLAAHCTGTDLWHAPELRAVLPRLPEYLKLVASTQIRNMGSVAGNLVNASPIGDYTILLLALGARVCLVDGANAARELPLDAFYRGYKQLDLAPDERITAVRFPAPPTTSRFHFEKVSKRTHLDIASVNTAALVDVADGRITSARVSAGGVAPVPLLLRDTSAWLSGRPFTEATFAAAGDVVQAEVTPIADVRGSVRYKRLLLRNLLLAHFFELSAARGGHA